MKRLFIYLLLIIIPFAFSSCGNETPTEIVEVNLEKIECLDSEKNDLTSIEYVIGQTEYIYKNVHIYAYFSDGKASEVTAFVSFSDIDLTTTGEKKVEVEYQGLVDDFIVIIKKIEVKRIEIDTTNVNKLYSINDWLELNELKVYSITTDNKSSLIKDYECEITYNGTSLKDKQLKYSGIYQILISYMNKYASFEVYAYDLTYDFSINIDLSDKILENGEYEYQENEVIFDNTLYSLMSYGSVSVNKYNNGSEVDFVFADYYFDYILEIDSESGLVIESKEDFEMLMIIEGYNDSIYITDSASSPVTPSVFNYNDDLIVHINSFKGIYTFKCLSSVKIKAILVNVEENYEYNDIIVDTSNTKTEFLLEDSFNYDGLKLFYDNGPLEIDINTCDIYLTYNNKKVENFSTSGIYKVIIEFTDINGKDKSLSYSIIVSKSDYSYSLDLDLTNVKTVFENDDTFNYDGLKVYYNENGYSTLVSLDDCEIKLFYDNGKEVYSVSSFVILPGKYYVEVLYKNGSISLIETYDVTYNSNVNEYDNFAEIYAELISDHTYQIQIASYVESIVDINIVVYENDKVLTAISTFNFNLTNVDKDKEYRITGYYTGKINDKLYIIYVDNTIQQNIE